MCGLCRGLKGQNLVARKRAKKALPPSRSVALVGLKGQGQAEHKNGEGRAYDGDISFRI